MIKIDLKKQLESKRSKSISKASDFLKESKLLLESNESKELDALRIAKLDHHVKVVETNKSIEIEREKFEESYGNTTFTEEEIKEICIKYDLRLLNSKYFKGKLDSQLSYKLRDFIEKNPEVGNSSDSFYVIAPSNAFDLQDRPAKPFLDIDPILLYKVDKWGEDSKFIYVHKWGEDFTILRRLRGIFFESTSNMWTISMSVWIILLSLLFGTSGNFVGTWAQYTRMIPIIFFSIPLSFASLAILFNDGESFYKRTSNYIWNSRTKRRR